MPNLLETKNLCAGYGEMEILKNVDFAVGAGTITANYDGVNKHRTTIGARVKSSVHVSCVAPVTVGDDVLAVQ